MKFNEVLVDIVVEEFKNRKLFNFLFDKWRTQNPNLTADDVEKILDVYTQKKEGLKPDRPQVFSFLSRFDGRHGHERFDPNNLKDIRKYTYEQIKFLIDEYSEEQETNTDDVFSGKDTKPTEERIEASKALWEGQEYLIINEDGFRVYDIPDQKTSIKFGYYVEKINKNIPGSHAPWCVTWRSDQGRTNMWGSYRNNRSFYFVIDESKSPSDLYYLGALQRVPSEDYMSRGYKLTSLKNDGDNSMTWQQIVNIYPKIENYRDKIGVKPFSPDELQEKNVVGQINEIEGNQYEFKRMSRALKKSYIENNGTLNKVESWRSMDTKLRELYILSTVPTQVRDKFNNYEFVKEIRKVGSEFTLLDNRLKAIGLNGVGQIFDNLMSTEFKVARRSIDNTDIRIYESIKTKKFGIFSSRKLNWYEKDGNVYEPLYSLTSIEAFKDVDNNKKYIVEIYSNGSTVNEKSFYAAFDMSAQNVSKSAHLFTYGAWNKLKETGKIVKQDETKRSGDIKNLDPETDVDIKELKKGV